MRNPFTAKAILKATAGYSPGECGVYFRALMYMQEKGAVPETTSEVLRHCGVSLNHFSRYKEVVEKAVKMYKVWVPIVRVPIVWVPVLDTLTIKESNDSELETTRKPSENQEALLYNNNNIYNNNSNEKDSQKAGVKHELLRVAKPSEMLQLAPSRVEALMKANQIPMDQLQAELAAFDLRREGVVFKDINHVVNSFRFWCQEYNTRAKEQREQKFTNGAAPGSMGYKPAAPLNASEIR